jgi:Peptidase_C39 like family
MSDDGAHTDRLIVLLHDPVRANSWSGAVRPRVWVIFVFAGVLLIGSAAHARNSISLDVKPRLQRTLVWCWLAVSKMVIAYYNDGDAPDQCRIMEWGYRLPRHYCCSNVHNCEKTGSLEEISRFIEHYSNQASVIVGPPPSPRSIYRALARNNLIVAAISSGLGAGHVVVVRGLRLRNDRYELLINDPMSKYPTVVDFEQFRSVWMQSIVIRYVPREQEPDEDFSDDNGN